MNQIKRRNYLKAKLTIDGKPLNVVCKKLPQGYVWVCDNNSELDFLYGAAGNERLVDAQAQILENCWKCKFGITAKWYK